MTSSKRKRTAAGLVAVATGTLVLAACGSSGSSSAGNPSVSAPVESAADDVAELKLKNALATPQQIFDNLAGFIRDRGGNSDITSETRIADLGVDSLDLVEAVMDCEESFGVSIPDTYAEQFQTVGDFVNFVANQKS